MSKSELAARQIFHRTRQATLPFVFGCARDRPRRPPSPLRPEPYAQLISTLEGRYDGAPSAAADSTLGPRRTPLTDAHRTHYVLLLTGSVALDAAARRPTV
jgi:hypothetical protein